MLRARDIADICDDIPLERVSVTTQEGWDYHPHFTVMFGPLSYRQTLQIDPKMSLEAVRAKLEAAKREVLEEYVRASAREHQQWKAAQIEARKKRQEAAPAMTMGESQEAKPSPEATPAPAKGKRKRKGEDDGH